MYSKIQEQKENYKDEIVALDLWFIQIWKLNLSGINSEFFLWRWCMFGEIGDTNTNIETSSCSIDQSFVQFKERNTELQEIVYCVFLFGFFSR